MVSFEGNFLVPLDARPTPALPKFGCTGPNYALGRASSGEQPPFKELPLDFLLSSKNGHLHIAPETAARRINSLADTAGG